MKTNLNTSAWLQKLALSLGLTAVLSSFAAPATAQGFQGQQQFGNPAQYGPQFGGDQQMPSQGQYGPQQQQFNRPQQGGQQQFGGQPNRSQFGPQQQPQMNRGQFNGQNQFAPQQPQFGGQGQQQMPGNFRNPSNSQGSMQGRGGMPRTVGGPQRNQGGQMNGNQFAGNQMNGNQMNGNPNFNRNAMPQNGQGMNRGQFGGNPNPNFNAQQANFQGGRNFANQNQGQAPQGQQFQAPQFQGQQFQGQQFQGPQNEGQIQGQPQNQGPQFQGQQFQGQQFQGQQNQGQQFQQNQFGQNLKAGQFHSGSQGPAAPAANFGQPQKSAEEMAFDAAMAGGAAAAPAQTAGGADLVLKSIEMVLDGNPTTSQGPVYRVTVLNKGNAAVTTAFEVGLIATNGNDPDESSPAAGERIASIAPGQVAVVEIQLPEVVNQLGQAETGEPQPFTTLFVVVDARQEITELDKSNNASKMPRTGVRQAPPTGLTMKF